MPANMPTSDPYTRRGGIIAGDGYAEFGYLLLHEGKWRQADRAGGFCAPQVDVL